MTISMFALKGELNGKILLVCFFFFCRVYISKGSAHTFVNDKYVFAVATFICVVPMQDFYNAFYGNQANHGALTDFYITLFICIC